MLEKAVESWHTAATNEVAITLARYQDNAAFFSVSQIE